MMNSVVVTNEGELVENEMMDSVVVTNEGEFVENEMTNSEVVMNEMMDAWILRSK